jgi:hypothetical protein
MSYQIDSLETTIYLVATTRFFSISSKRKTLPQTLLPVISADERINTKKWLLAFPEPTDPETRA